MAFILCIWHFLQVFLRLLVVEHVRLVRVLICRF